MIELIDKKDCCGCSACAQRCPKQCIKMLSDEEGFLYPYIDKKSCIDCGLCEKICPILNSFESEKKIDVFSAYHKDESIRKKSSSGGVFTSLSESVLRRGGVVFGARFDEKWQVCHSYTETEEGLVAFKGSKYVQSRIGTCYKEVETFLKQNRVVLFSGTPCQIAGLKHYLCKDYSNLITVDVICHGVPSPMVWMRYFEEILCQNGVVGKKTVLSQKEEPFLTSLSFRDKRTGWRKYGFSVWYKAIEDNNERTSFSNKREKRLIHEIMQENLFFRGFSQNLYLRPSCHKCNFRNYKSGSDITIADFWGIENVFPDMDDDKGTSLVIVKTQKAKELLESCSLFMKMVKHEKYDLAFKGNSSLFKDDIPNKHREAFFYELNKEQETTLDLINKYTLYSDFEKKKSRMDHILLSIGLYDMAKCCINIIRKIKK